jgi:hypothetical protein
MEKKEFTDPKPKSAQNHKWREPTWMKCDAELEEIIIQRKKVLARAKTYIPTTINERYEVAKVTLIKELSSKKTETM